MRQGSLPGAILAICLVAIGGCQSYAPEPIDLRKHRESWRLRLPNGEDVKAYADRLRAGGGGSASVYDPNDGVNLGEAEIIALFFNPSLRLARAESGVARAVADHAGAWDDPELDVSVLSVLESVDRPWLSASGLAFTIPLSGRLSAEKDEASAEATKAHWQVHVEEWKVLLDLRRRWLRWSADRERAELTRAFLVQLDRVVAAADSLAEGGEIGRTDARLLHIERAMRRAAVKTLDVSVATAELELRAALGLTPDAPVKFEPSLRVGDEPLTLAERMKRLENRNPRLNVLRAAYAVAEETLRREVLEQYPDLKIGPVYETEESVHRLGLSLSLPLPFWNANRGGIARARAARTAARVAFEAEYEGLVHELRQADARARGARSMWEYRKNEVGPLVDTQMAEMQRLADLGEINVLLLLEGLTRAYKTKLELLDARLREALARLELSSLVCRRHTFHGTGGKSR